MSRIGINSNYTSPIFGTVLPILSEFNTDKQLYDNYLLKSDAEISSKTSKTKMVCTLGPSSNTKEVISRFLEHGMSVARLNLSHGSLDQHENNVKTVRQLANYRMEFCPIMADLSGDALRMAPVEGNCIPLKKGNIVHVKSGDIDTMKSCVNCIYVNDPDILKVFYKLKNGFILRF